MKKTIFVFTALIFIASFTIASEVHLSSPSIVKTGEEFSIYIAASNLQNFYSADLIVRYNSSAMSISGIYNGSINGTEIAVNYSLDDGACRIVALSTDGGIDGNGYLAVLRVVSLTEGKFNVTIEGNLSNYNAEMIEASWDNLSLAFTSSELRVETKDIVNGEFMAYINLTNATQFYSINFTLLYDDTFVMPEGIEGNISLSYSISSGKIKFAGYVENGKNVSEMNIARILFRPLKTGYTFLNLSQITASDIFAQQIYCLAANKSILISGNIPPIANFTWQPSMPTDLDEITFNASNSYDSDGYIANYTWDFGDESIAYGMIAKHSYADDGIYNVTLAVKDNDGATSVTWKLITVANVPPIANFTFTTQFLHVSFNSTSYDLDGFITNYTWDFGDGSIAYGKNVNHEYGGEGSYIVNLSVRDDDGSVAWISREVVVSLANHPPYATSPSPSNGSVDIAIDIQISVYVYDEDGDMLTVKFYDALNNKEIGEAGNVDSGSKATVAWNGLDFSKTYYWYVIVSDGKEETKSDIWHFSTRANSPPSKPEISGVESGYTGMTYSFSAKSNDEDGDKIRYGFDWNNDGIIDEWSDFVTSGKAAARSHSWSSEGVYYIRVIAEDEYGAKSEWSNLHQIIIMQYTPPPPNTKPFISIEEPKEGDVLSGIVEIKGIAWDEDGDEIQKVEIRIDGQGWKEVGKGANWIYTWDTTEVANGLHEIEARCYDGKDYSEVARINVTVNNFVNEPPQLKIIYPVNGSTVSGIIIIKGEAWDKNGNETLVKVEVRIDEQEWREANGTTSWSFQLDTTKFANGLHEIEVRCYDGKDYSEVARVSIEVKNEGEEGGRGIAIAAIILIAFGAIAAFLIYRRRRL